MTAFYQLVNWRAEKKAFHCFEHTKYAIFLFVFTRKQIAFQKITCIWRLYLPACIFFPSFLVNWVKAFPMFFSVSHSSTTLRFAEERNSGLPVCKHQNIGFLFFQLNHYNFVPNFQLVVLLFGFREIKCIALKHNL